MEKRNQWKSTTGFIFATIGSAVGLGNIWRFTYLAGKNGGGAFLIPYFTALLLVGIPLLILEYALGHEKESSAPMAFAKVGHSFEWVGWWAVTFVMFGIVMYYMVVIGWAFNYFLFSFNLSWGQDTQSFFFNKYLMLSSGPGEVGDIRTPILLTVALIWVINWFIVYKGIQKGIERANKIFMPILFGMTIILVVWGLTLPGARQGVLQYLKPDFSILSDRQVWVDAFGQIFFTLSLGFGIMIAYASYLPRKTDIFRNALITSLANCGFSFIAGFAVFSTLGYMALQSGSTVQAVLGSGGVGLAFITYPQLINSLPVLNGLFGMLFFGMLVIAGISSSISIVEAFSSAVIDKFRFKRKAVVTVICITGFAGSVIFTSRGGLFWLDIVDHFLTNFGLIIVGILEALLIGWMYKASVLRDHINRSRYQSGLNLGIWWDFMIRLVIPLVLGYILVNGFLNEIAAPYEGYGVKELLLIGKDWLMYTLLIAIILSMARRKVEYHK